MTAAAPGAPTVAGELVRRLGAERVVADPDRLEAYRRDHAGVPVVARGAGSGLSGGANALDGCIVLSTAAVTRILAIDPAERTADGSVLRTGGVPRKNVAGGRVRPGRPAQPPPGDLTLRRAHTNR